MNTLTKEYNIILNTALTKEEEDRLDSFLDIFKFRQVNYKTCVINLISPYDLRDTVAKVAMWTSRIGADGDIFCIQEITNFYTNFVSTEISEKLRTLSNEVKH